MFVCSWVQPPLVWCVQQQHVMCASHVRDAALVRELDWCGCGATTAQNAQELQQLTLNKYNRLAVSPNGCNSTRAREEGAVVWLCSG